MAPPTTSTTTQDSLFSLPTELLTTLAESFPCRGPQIRTLATLVYPTAAPVRNLIIHGVEATGKSAITARTLGALHDHDPSVLDYAVVRSAECVTARHLYERTVGAVADAVAEHLDARPVARCETLAALAVELGRLLERYDGQGTRDEDGDDDGDKKRKTTRRFVLVFDGIDRQREAPPTLLPALARLSEMIPNLTTIFITTSPPTSSLRLPSAPATLAFPAYTKAEYVAILSYTGPPDQKKPLPNSTAAETAELWARFAAATHDALIRPAGAGAGAGGGLTALLRACRALWPRFTAPVAAGTHRAREFGRLLVAARVLFQDERVLVPGVLAAKPSSSSSFALPLPSTSTSTPTPSAPGTPSKQGAPTPTTTTNNKTAGSDLATLLPRTARLLLIAAYLASHNAPRHDDAIFSTWDSRKKKRRKRQRGPNKNSSLRQHRRIARRLLGPGAFVLERMVAIYAATRREWVTADPHYADHDHDNDGGGGVDADVAMALATLSSLRLLVRVGAGAGAGGGGWGGGADLDRGAKWRVNVGWEVIRALGRSMGVEVEEWLVE